ncbi:hypothetical protein [Serratia oryzae]|uniref:hypothetical protein n=1 Tax=Serratia oryzae TaxID=2034155 RepID=UPI0012E2AAE0|nr:hypothetical protein [Serratia oryzae]
MYRKLMLAMMVCFLSLALGACVVSTPPTPWFEGDKNWPSAHQVNVERNGKQESIEIIVNITCADESALWISLYAHNYSGANHSARIPIMYSNQRAYIEKENGKRIISDAAFYDDLSLKTGDMPAKRCSGTTSSAGSRPAVAYSALQAETINLNGEQRGIALRFETALPARGSRWTLHLGQLTVDNIKIDIPEKIIILRGREWRTHPFQ